MKQACERHGMPRVAMIAAVLAGAGNVFGQVTNQTLVLDGKAPGKVFEGVGAVSGGGATSVLLKDYPEPQRNQILDILFKPQFGASMQTFYVEIAGDGNSTQGTEPTHMRTRTEENYSRGYEWWLMVEAKKRNPALTLDACAWSAPGWVGDGPRNTNGNFWSQDMCDYYVKWIKGLKTDYGLTLDAIGCRNERGENINWVNTFRTTLNNNGLKDVRIHAFDSPGNATAWNWVTQMRTDNALNAAMDIVGNHCLPDTQMPPAVRATIDQLAKPVWNTEEHVYNEGRAKNYPTEFASALGCVHLFNTNYIGYGATKIVNWYLCGSTYPIEPYFSQPPALFASSPWSGHYQIKPIVWSYAHYGQFTKIGWKYVPGGCAVFTGGGSAVTLKSDTGDYSVIAETAGAAGPQSVTFKVVGLSAKPLCVWRSTREAQFVKLADVTPDKDGNFTYAFDPEAIYSLSTTGGQQKGNFDVPADQPFPFPYLDNFDHYGDAKQWGYLPHYLADICGVFELADRPDKAGKSLRQVVNWKSQSWAPEWKPYTVLGDQRWTDYEVSADVFFDNGGWAGVMGHISNTGNGWDGDPNGFYAKLGVDGACAIYVASSNIRGTGRDQQLAAGTVPNFKKDAWHNVKLRFVGTKMTMLVDNAAVVNADSQSLPQNQQSERGLAGLITGGDGDARNSALFDNLLINTVNGRPVAPTIFAVDGHPIYKP
jgi:galactosylceramidase